MKLDISPISTMLDGVTSLTGAWMVFFLGVFGGTGLAGLIMAPGWPTNWGHVFLFILFIVPITMFMIFGLLLIPIYIVVFYGLAWKEWNRLLCWSILAMSTSIVVLLSIPFSESEPGSEIRFIIIEGILAALIVVGALGGRWRVRWIEAGLDAEKNNVTQNED